MSKQKQIFIKSEADGWFDRNENSINNRNLDEDLIIKAVSKLDLNYNDMLEIGCASGYRLNEFNKMKKANYQGIEPSQKAVEKGRELYPDINIQIGTADALPFEDESFDVIIYGFCLYLCDRADLFAIASEGDRVLKDGGAIIILDFAPSFPYSNDYSHAADIKSYKMEYANMFLWNPKYVLNYRHMLSHDQSLDIQSDDDRISVDVLYKQEDEYVNNPYND